METIFIFLVSLNNQGFYEQCLYFVKALKIKTLPMNASLHFKTGLLNNYYLLSNFKKAENAYREFIEKF
jgi:hypothetical protein